MSTLIAEFTVVGTPVPQGSMRSFERHGKVISKANNAGALERWRGDVRSAVRIVSFARQGPGGPVPLPATGPISMRMAFRLPRPKSHFLPANRSRPEPVLRPDAPTWAPGGKDLDKLVRAVMDALTGVLYVDDSQVVVIGATKVYADPELAPAQPGVDVRVSAL